MAEEKQEETTTTEEESEETVDADVEDTEDTESEEESEAANSGDDSEEEEVDWKKIAEENEAARKKAERKLADDRFKSKHRKNNDDDDYGEDDEDEDRPLTARELQRILADERQATRREVQSGQIKEIAKDLAESEDEATAIIAIHAARNFPEDMPLKQQLEEAFYIAHGPRLTAKIGELRRSLKSKGTKRDSGSENSHRDEPNKVQPKISAAERTELERIGFKWNGKTFSKKLSDGKTLVRDPKSGKTYLQS